MPDYQLIIFDLDGTLTDSAPIILHSARVVETAFNLEPKSDAVLRSYIGIPLIEIFLNKFGLDEEKAQLAIKIYVDAYDKYSKELGDIVYPGIPELLRKLNGIGKIVSVGTAKMKFVAERVLRDCGLAEHFAYVGGLDREGGHVRDKTGVIKSVMDQFPSISPSQIVMIGDSMHDVNGAKKNGIDSIAVTYGYGTLEELAGSEPTYTIDKIVELENILL